MLRVRILCGPVWHVNSLAHRAAGRAVAREGSRPQLPVKCAAVHGLGRTQVQRDVQHSRGEHWSPTPLCGILSW